MKESIKNKLTKKEKDMNKGSGVMGFALAGLAAGIATWYLFGTKDGRANLDRAIEGINELSGTIKAKAKEQMENAADTIDKAKNKFSEMKGEVLDEVEDAKNKAGRRGREIVEEAQEMAQKANQRATKLANEAKNDLQ